jgi:predicted nucleic acid-binding protein
MIGVDTTFLVHLEIAEMPEHARAHELLRREVFAPNEELAMAPQTLAEFVHVVTDGRRFQRPLTMEQALSKASFWWKAREVRHVYPTAESTALFLEWMSIHQLGRKRLLDTQLAADLWTAGVRRILTSNARDFAVFGGFEIITP